VQQEGAFEKEYTMRCLSPEWIARNGLPWDDAIVVSAGKLRKLWDSLSELRGSLCERRLERTVLRPALLPVKTSQFTQFFRQVWRHTPKLLRLTKCIGRFRPRGHRIRQEYRNHASKYYKFPSQRGTQISVFLIICGSCPDDDDTMWSHSVK